MTLLSPASANTKTRKSQIPDYRIVGLALSPADSAGGKTNCANATTACKAACVANVGLHNDRPAFIRALKAEFKREADKAEQDGAQLAVRLNTFSDIPWETKAYGYVAQYVIDELGGVCYDYTKLYARVRTSPVGYHLCASWTEDTKDQMACADLLQDGFNVAVVFADLAGSFVGNRALLQRIPERWTVNGTAYRCFDGDSSELRFLDPVGRTKGLICALRLKSSSGVERQKAIDSGFCQLIGGVTC